VLEPPQAASESTSTSTGERGREESMPRELPAVRGRGKRPGDAASASGGGLERRLERLERLVGGLVDGLVR
jgi:hypothetical protein